MADILLTGASSFTGLWIAEALASAGHAVTAPLKRPASDYSGLRRQRVERLGRSAEVIFDTPFASQALLALVASRRFDLLGHHAADIVNYRSADYDPAAGFSRNVDGADAVFEAFSRSGGRAVIATGTAFEPGEGGEGPEALAVSPYGLSKGLTNQALRHMARWRGLGFGKFVIAGPFGRLEEGRFAWSMFQAWFDDRPGVVRTPRYVRDNIPAPVLAAAYSGLVHRMLAGAEDLIARPQGFVGTQEAFGRRLAAAMAPRLGRACAIESMDQPRLDEPETRINSEPAFAPGWDEAAFWDDYAAYYQETAAAGLLAAPA